MLSKYFLKIRFATSVFFEFNPFNKNPFIDLLFGGIWGIFLGSDSSEDTVNKASYFR